MLGVASAGKDVSAHRYTPVTAARFVGREVKLGVALVVACDKAAAPASGVALTFSSVVNEDIICEYEVARLVYPSAATAIAEGVPGDRHIFARLLHAENSR